MMSLFVSLKYKTNKTFTNVCKEKGNKKKKKNLNKGTNKESVNNAINSGRSKKPIYFVTILVTIVEYKIEEKKCRKSKKHKLKKTNKRNSIFITEKDQIKTNLK